MDSVSGIAKSKPRQEHQNRRQRYEWGIRSTGCQGGRESSREGGAAVECPEPKAAHAARAAPAKNRDAHANKERSHDPEKKEQDLGTHHCVLLAG